MKPRNRALPGRIANADLRLLRVFRAVADCGGLAAAELELGISLSTISRHIKDLEHRLGLVLCRRGRSGFSLSAEGKRVYESATRLLNEAEVFRTTLRGIHHAVGDQLQIALFEQIASNPRARVAESLRRFNRQVPDVALGLSSGNIADIERGVIDGRYHIGLIPEHRRSETLEYRELFSETMLLYAGQGHAWYEAAGARRSWNDLRGQELAGLDFGKIEQVVQQRNEMHSGAVDILQIFGVAFVADRTETLRHDDLGEAGHGIERRADLVADLGEEFGFGGG